MTFEFDMAGFEEYVNREVMPGAVAAMQRAYDRALPAALGKSYDEAASLFETELRAEGFGEPGGGEPTTPFTREDLGRMLSEGQAVDFGPPEQP